MDLSLAQLRTKLRKGLRGGSFYLHGADDFLRAEAMDLILEAHLAAAEASFNLDTFRGDAVSAEALAAALATPPVLASYRVVVLRDAQQLNPSTRTALESVLERVPPDVAFVVTADPPKGSKAKFYDRLKRAGVAVRCESPPESALPGWLMERARAAHGVELDPAAAALLSSYLGRALGPLAEELRKLTDYVSPRTRIEADDVRAVVGALPQMTRYEWVDLVLDREMERALGALRPLLDGGESGVGLVNVLGEAFLKVGLAGAGGDALAEAIRRQGAWRYLAWKVPAYRAWSKAWPRRAVERALDECLRTDRLLKSGGLTEVALVEELVLRLLAEAAPEAAAS